MGYKIKIIVLAVLVNTVIFFFLPYIKYLQDKKLAELLTGSKKQTVVRTFTPPPEVKKREIKLQKQQRQRENQSNNDRFKLDLALDTGVGVGIGGDAGENLIYQEGDVDVLPQKRSGNNPEIPSLFASSGKSGKVEVQVVIDEAGNVLRVQPLSEEPQGYGLKNSVVSVIWNWKFRPATLKNIPVKIQVIIPFVF